MNRTAGWLIAVLIVLGLCGQYMAIRGVHSQIETSERGVRAYLEGEARPYALVRMAGKLRVVMRRAGEDRDDWTARVALAGQVESMGGEYICTTLTGCDPPVTEVEVCTWCEVSPPSDPCLKEHELDVEAIRRALGCD